MEDDIDKILCDWSLEAYIEIFKENKIDAGTLNLLDSSMVAELIKPIGDRAKFIKNLDLWKKMCYDDNFLNKSLECDEYQILNFNEVSYLNPKHKQSTWSDLDSCTSKDPEQEKKHISVASTTSCQEDQCSSDSQQQEIVITPQPACSSFTNERKPLQELLKQSVEGRSLLKLHKEEGLLTNNSRRKLCNLIIHHILSDDPNIKVSHDILFKYAQEIKSVFNKENASIYFVPYINNHKMKVKACAKGKLYDCLHNRKRDYRHAEKKERTLLRPESRQKTDDPQSKEDLEEEIHWLQNSTEPWELVEKKWQSTTTLRNNELNTTEKTIAAYMDEFPILKTPSGYQLLLLDFNHLYPGKENLLYENLALLKEKIISYAERKADRDPAIKEIIDVNETISDMDDSVKASQVKTFLALLALPLLLGNPLGKGRKSSWRPSKQEARDGFITHICTPSDLQTTIQRRRDKFQTYNLTLQPFIVVVGRDYLNIEKYYVVINNTLYSLYTILDAVDVCFKTFHVLNCRYPIECISTWQFIQKGLYKMQTPWDKNFVSINTFLADLGIETQ